MLHAESASEGAIVRTAGRFGCVVIWAMFGASAFGQDAGALAKRIDAVIEKRLREDQVPASAPAEDAEFLRRVTLDLTGKIPTYERAVAFFESSAPDRRAKLVDELLASPEFSAHFASMWAQWILGTELGPQPREAFKGWLASQLHAGAGWDRVVRAMLVAEGDPKTQPETAFVLAQTDDGKLAPNVMAAATTRYFLGVQLQCAECHNHPYTSWKQAEFWGMAAFFSRVRVATPKKGDTAQPVGLTEALPPADPKAKKPAADVGTIVIPTSAGKAAGKPIRAKFLEADEPSLEPDGAARPRLADWVTSPQNPFFARATANRVWFALFGRGLVNPVDDMHAANDPSHPELLADLAEDLKASGFSVKHLVRAICNSQTYQRTSRPAKGNEDAREHFARMPVRVMGPDVLYDSLVRVLGVKELNVVTGKLATTGKGGAPKSGSGRDAFVKFFKTADADTVPTDFTHGIPQILNLMNDPQFNKNTPVVDRLAQAKLPRAEAVTRLYVTVLSRTPTSAESARIARYLEGEPDVARGYRTVLWALVNSPEFILNH